MQTDPKSLVGRSIDGRYQMERVLGRGATGVVYAASHLGLDRKVAIKVLLDAEVHPDDLPRLRAEGRALARVSHPNVVKAFDSGITNDGLAYLVMEKLNGEDFDSLLKEKPNRRLTWQQLRPLAVQLCCAMQAVHDAGLVHRDLKPTNLFVCMSADRKTQVLKVLDFGIAKFVGGLLGVEQTRQGQVLGTPMFMAPELLLGAIPDCRADVYSTGCILFTALVGKRPFTGNSLETLVPQKLAGLAPTEELEHSEVPVELAHVLLKAMKRDSNDRYSSMKELGAVLIRLNSKGACSFHASNHVPLPPPLSVTERKVSEPPTDEPALLPIRRPNISAAGSRTAWSTAASAALILVLSLGASDTERPSLATAASADPVRTLLPSTVQPAQPSPAVETKPRAKKRQTRSKASVPVATRPDVDLFDVARIESLKTLPDENSLSGGRP